MDDVIGRAKDGGGYALEDLTVGMSEQYERQVTDIDVRRFAEVSGDHNPVHLDEDFAQASRFNGRIAHGMLSASFISTAIASRLPGPGTIYLDQRLAFRAPVRLGDIVIATVTVTELLEKRRVRLATVCTVGDTVVVEGEAVVMVPRA